MLNLLPPSLRRQASRRRRLWLVAASLTTAAAWGMLTVYLRPAHEPARSDVVIRQETAPSPAETSPAPPAASPALEAEKSIDLELLGVKTAPFPLQLAGYFGEPGAYLVAFINADQPEALLVRRGHRFEQLGLTLQDFEVGKIAVNHDDPWPVYEATGRAVLHNEKSGLEIVLDGRRKPPGTLQAVLRGGDSDQPSTRVEGELITQGGATYRILRIQADPPEVFIVRQAGGLAAAEVHVLQPVRPASERAELSAKVETASFPPGF